MVLPTACHYTCKSCNGNLSGNCLACDTATRDIISGSCICKNGYYDDGSSQACLACNTTKCTKCSGSAANCTECLPGTGRSAPPNCTCNAGYYDLGSSCGACHYSCVTCTGNTSSNCLTCDTAIR